jgi:hypothetical protein
LAIFDANDPLALPWATTKADIDKSNDVYRRAVLQMKDATKTFIEYTNKRKASLTKARSLEDQTITVPAFETPASKQLKLPNLQKQDDVEMTNILYQKPKEVVIKVAAALGNPKLSGRMVGLKTFEYYYDHEVE